ncbi:radical SAM enzyme, Cfr family [Desulfitobacterium hafniense DCB-2]|uniref:Probable dual-specificity RNA methyltransferase RlmN n=1 Tax=Desulfitobacterium hafniense (strain DSM 10664 / DCB-2) TaxID=272564 RepID=RLMN_DESHD|nr:23S rRNA (adenine(2503)-C(2))-methyltransferase RlmN [Desulfitobacterium hafniense]B8FS78.1 RecName: Full=Probable dual-specificity RNA methyltransferase RlmN; AltName: Full=23S rRNA (adenine(2503)-C(2))-methyltransferase; AltName: Full=23S rRNA m2A2503 methyltransferase; AltName: Full=Ribosomal RNA large subunit methyltransferase N; AltName: Full=tRNA (adenine(37)-C(2))-methyltransferase; AltName: Full=tRNA m2A37 methyltransferase [Desulfitobacterium hafniense DCB-2]ACL21866.1 radical SAM enz
MNTMKRMDCRDLNQSELTQHCAELGLPKFRGRQVFQWVQQKAVQNWEELRNIGAGDRQKLQEGLFLQPLRKVREQIAQDGTRKFLFRCADGETLECVLMDYDRRKNRDRHTVCVSTQIGCAVGCAFCATGLGGWRRNLSPGEILGQVLDITYLMRQEDPDFQVTNIVFMGMGEPLLNYEAVLKAIELLNDPEGQGIGMRRMTISTSGVAPKIRQLAKDNPQVGLAVSLHSAHNTTRDQLIPMNRKYPLEELMEACGDYTTLTNRRITFEIALISGQATLEAAQAVGHLLKGQLAHVNLIPVNPVAGTGMARPTAKEVQQFAQSLESMGIPVSVREEKGTDIDAACGQLRRQLECEQK